MSLENPDTPASPPARARKAASGVETGATVIARHAKTAPAGPGVYRMFDAEGQVLYVGDRVDNDVLPAMDFGMRTCWLRRGPWGQLQELPDDVEPDLVLEGLGELPLLLQGWREETAGE